MTVVRSIWQVKPFRFAWGASGLSTLGAEIGELALPALALITLGASAAEASWVRAAQLAPFLLVTIWVGVLVDRRRRRPLMVLADLVRAAVLAALCVAAVLGVLTIPLLIGATFLLGAMTVVSQLAEFSFLPHFVPQERLIDANATMTATQSSIQVAGAGVGGVLVQALSAPVAVAVNALGYLGSALLVAKLPSDEPTPERSGSSALQEAKAGLRFLLRHPMLRALTAESTIWNFGNEIFMLALTVRLLSGERYGALALGGIVTCGALGAVLGSVASTRLTTRFGFGRSLIASLLLGNTAPLAGVIVAAIWPVTAVVALPVAFFLSGIGIGIDTSQVVALRQLATEPALRGRVNAGHRLASWGALAIGALLAGALVTLAGTVPSAIAGTVLMAAASMPVALSPVRRMRGLDDAASQTDVPS